LAMSELVPKSSFPPPELKAGKRASQPSFNDAPAIA
jgi:hypothetical protein